MHQAVLSKYASGRTMSIATDYGNGARHGSSHCVGAQEDNRLDSSVSTQHTSGATFLTLVRVGVSHTSYAHEAYAGLWPS